MISVEVVTALTSDPRIVLYFDMTQCTSNHNTVCSVFVLPVTVCANPT
jgi:hypothetical protein